MLFRKHLRQTFAHKSVRSCLVYAHDFCFFFCLSRGLSRYICNVMLLVLGNTCFWTFSAETLNSGKCSFWESPTIHRYDVTLLLHPISQFFYISAGLRWIWKGRLYSPMVTHFRLVATFTYVLRY